MTEEDVMFVRLFLVSMGTLLLSIAFLGFQEKLTIEVKKEAGKTHD
jgi:hypothetical protein